MNKAPQITTDRLLLRALDEADAAAFAAIVGDWEVARMTCDIPHPFSLTDTGLWLSPRQDDYRFAIVRDGRLIGCAGFFLHGEGLGELGFFIAPAQWGLGYAGEAVREVMAFGMEQVGVAGFTASHFADNDASARLLSRLGFRPVGSARAWCEARSCEADACYYEFKPERPAALRAGAATGGWEASA